MLSYLFPAKITIRRRYVWGTVRRFWNDAKYTQHATTANGTFLLKMIQYFSFETLRKGMSACIVCHVYNVTRHNGMSVWTVSPGLWLVKSLDWKTQCRFSFDN